VHFVEGALSFETFARWLTVLFSETKRRLDNCYFEEIKNILSTFLASLIRNKQMYQNLWTSKSFASDSSCSIMKKCQNVNFTLLMLFVIKPLFFIIMVWQPICVLLICNWSTFCSNRLMLHHKIKWITFQTYRRHGSVAKVVILFVIFFPVYEGVVSSNKKRKSQQALKPNKKQMGISLCGVCNLT